MVKEGLIAMRVVAVTGLAAEAAIARRAGLAAVCGGGDRAATEAAIARAAADGAAALLSFGIAGALAPKLRPGTVVIADRVAGVAARPLPLAVAGLRGIVAGAAAPVASTRAKAALFAATGALAVDLETDLVARAGLPYGVLRVVADPAERDLPRAALVGLKPDGTPALAAVLGAVARAPWQIPALLRLAWETRAALSGLARALPAGAAERLLAAGAVSGPG
jgi:hypothetical protein